MLHLRPRLLGLAVAMLALAPLTAQEVPVRTVGTARLENVPAIPDAVQRASEAYATARAASLADWFDDGSLLIQTRLGTVDQLHRVIMPGGARSQLTFAPEPVAVGYATKGRSFAFIRDTGGDEQFQVYVQGLSGQPRAFTAAGTRNLLTAVSPDRKLIGWSSTTRGSSDYSVVIADPSDPDSTRIVYSDKGSAYPASFSADNRLLAVTRQISSVEQALIVVDLQTGTSRQVSASAGDSIRSPVFLPNNRKLLAISNIDSDVARLVEIDIATGQQKVLTHGLEWDVEAIAVSPDGRQVAFIVNDEGYSRLHMLDLATGKEQAAPQLPTGIITGLKFSPDGKRLAFSLTAPNSAGDVWVAEMRSKRLVRWTTSELGLIDPGTLIEPQLVRFPSFDGLQIPAFVYRPAAQVGRRLPVVIDIHGGPEGQARPGFNPGVQHLLNQSGAVVIQPNVRGSSGYGKLFMTLDNGVKREDSVRDIGALLDWIGKQPDLDSSRIVVRGGSYGGYMVLASLVHYSDRLAGGMEAYGISDFLSFLENTGAYRRDLRRPEYGDERVPEVREVLSRISPLNNVGMITKPLLVMQGANDPRVPQRESDQIVAALRSRGVPAWYLLFSDEGHGFRKEPNEALRRSVETVFLRQVLSEVGAGGGPK